jgi:predicted membrane GTPase involved in stress response
LEEPGSLTSCTAKSQLIVHITSKTKKNAKKDRFGMEELKAHMGVIKDVVCMCDKLQEQRPICRIVLQKSTRHNARVCIVINCIISSGNSTKCRWIAWR